MENKSRGGDVGMNDEWTGHGSVLVVVGGEVDWRRL
jgi:hypothetical protein